jgi:hypothetical protein
MVKYVGKYGSFKKTDLEALKNEDLIEYDNFTGNISDITVTDRGNRFVHSMQIENQIQKADMNEQQFNQLLELYPKKTPRGRALQAGYRVNKEKWMKMYFTNLKKSNCTHQQVLEAVNNEVRSRTISNTLEYLSMLPTYINQGKWDSYINTSVINPAQYGEDFK